MGKFKFSYKRFAVTILVGAILATTTATAAFSYAWFTNHNNVTNNDLNGSTAGAYFARGKGTSDNPYVINKPIHLYNLAWLQYVGAFKDKEPYFIIEADLDMKDWTLPPIGTVDNPFMGHLNGYDKDYSHNQMSKAKISNLTVSNAFGDFNRHPSSVTSTNFASPEITGLFGVIEKPTPTSVPSVQNLYIDNLTVTSKTANALTGLVAGRVNGQLEGIGINNSKSNIADGTSKLDGYDKISKYTSVGYCTPEYETSYVKTNTTMYTPVQVGDPVSFNPTGGGGGEENDWGGSIDMRTLGRRLNYIGGVSQQTNVTTNATIADASGKNYHLNGYLPSAYGNPFDWQDEKQRISVPFFNICNGTTMPLNIDKDIAFKNGEITNNPPADSSVTWKTTRFYKNNTSEDSVILNSNTGYLVGGGKTNNPSVTFKMQPIVTGLANSFGNYGAPTRYDISSNAQHLVVSTVDTRSPDLTNNDATIQTIDAENFDAKYGCSKFPSVKKGFNDAMDGSTTAHGFHFFPRINISNPDIMSANYYVKIDGKAYSSYEFVSGGLNFTVAKPGNVTTLLGSYYRTGSTKYDKQSIFDLFKVQRTNGTIDSIKRINKIYKVDGEVKYCFEGDSYVPTNNVVFDFTKLSGGNGNFLDVCKTYYFEFPLLAGDYVIGKAKTSDAMNAYFMYLDIGANAGGTSGNKVDRTKIYEVFEQVNEEFKYPNGVEIVNFANAAIDTKKFAIVVGASYTGEVKLNYTGNNNASVTVTESSDTGLGYFDAGLTFTSGQKTQVGGTTTHTRTQRLTYFDYYRETELGTEALYTNVLQFSQTQTVKDGLWGDWSGINIVRSDYRSGEGDTTFTKYEGVGGLTILGDDGKSTTELPTITAPKSYDYNSNVFTLQTTDPTIPSINADWIQMGEYPKGENPTHYTFDVTGYKFTMNYTKDGTSTDLATVQYTATRNPDYAVSVNGTALA